jgi:glycosyltransferase involved in cell wall biosynthesis
VGREARSIPNSIIDCHAVTLHPAGLQPKISVALAKLPTLFRLARYQETRLRPIQMTLSSKHDFTVLFLISSEGYFGAENMLVTQAASLSRLGCRCVIGVFCDSRFRHSEVAARARGQGLTVEVVPCAGRCDWRTVARIRRLLGEYSVNILHAHGYKADLYAYAAAWPGRVALVATCHNWPSQLWSMRVYAALDRLCMKSFDRIVVVSDPVAAILRRSGIRAGKVETIFNGVEIERFRAAEPTLRHEVASDDESLVGFVGRLVPDKGGEILLRAAQQVLRARPRTKFVFVGDGPSRQAWVSLADCLGIGDHVAFTGMRQDMPGVYASFQLIVLPSSCEAMPMCVLEAMAAGKPVIATPVGAVPKLVVHDQTGVLVECGDIDGLAAAIVQILNNPERARRLGENGRARATEYFSAESMGRRYLELYQEVADIRDGAKKREMAWGVN